MEVKSESEVAQLCLTLSDPMDCSPPGSSIHGIFQARVLEWGAIAFSNPRCIEQCEWKNSFSVKEKKQYCEYILVWTKVSEMILKISTNNTKIYWEKKKNKCYLFFKGDYNILTIPEEGIWMKWGFFYKDGKNGVAAG